MQLPAVKYRTIGPEIGRSALPADEGVAEGFPHDVCASSNLTHEAPALPHVCRLAQRLHQWSDVRGDPLSDERRWIHERKHGISIAPVVRVRPDRQIWHVCGSVPLRRPRSLVPMARGAWTVTR
jgi:hypothetical protein